MQSRRWSLLVVSLAAVCVLGGCQEQEVTEDDTDVEPQGSGHTNFCKKALLSESGGMLYCNWRPTFAAACLPGPGISAIPKGAIISGPSPAGECPDGSALVKVTNN